MKKILTSKWFILGLFILIVLLWGAWFVAGYLDKRSADHRASQTAGHTASSSSTNTGSSQATGMQSTSATDETKPKKSKKQVAVPHALSLRPGKGIAFVEAMIRPMDYELNERFWGWRPNDIINVTDNVNNMQLGILEVTRRTAVALAETISRTGSTDSYVPSLEAAMNWFMIKPTKYWFPSAETKYQEGIDDLRTYLEMLKRGEARFYRRVDNLVPLLKAYESILGSCEENLVKEPGELSFFKSDDYFYYTKGVAMAMGTVLKAVAEDFDDTVASVQGNDVLQHAIEALHHAGHLSPWIVLEGNPDGFLANHRANMAGPISHARFYLDVLVIALTGNILS